MNIVYTPLTPDAVRYLSHLTEVDFSRTDFTGKEWLCVTARDDEGNLAGVLVCEFKTATDCHCTYAITNPRCMTRKLMRGVFTTLFSVAVRITSLVRPDNEHAISLVRRMGFRYEGFLRMGIEGKYDALIFGMLKEDCRYLERPDDGKFTQDPRPLQAGVC